MAEQRSTVATVRGVFVITDRQADILPAVILQRGELERQQAAMRNRLLDAAPGCNHVIEQKRGGGRCRKCGGWYLL